MSEQTVGGADDPAVVFAALADALAKARQVPLSSVSAVDLTSLLAQSETSLRQAEAVQRGLVAEIDRRGVAGGYGVTSTAALVAQRLLLTQRDAAARVRQARELAPRVALTGEPLAPLFAATAAALDAGQVSLAHARVITRTRSALPAAVDAACGDAAEQFLVGQALRLNPTQLGYAATRLLDTLNPDGKYTELADQERRRYAGLVDLPGGASKPTGYYTPELTAVLKPILDALSAPQSTGDEPDQRTPGQRVHDGLIEFGLRILRADALPHSGGIPVSILVTTTTEDLHAAQHGADPLVEIAGSAPLPLSTLLGMGGEIELTGIRLTCSGGIQSFGQTRRLATPGQRRALAARDKGCSFPGCSRTHAWAEVHHIIDWLHGGGTDLTNLVLLCRYHHRHFQQAGWKIQMNTDGIPEWIPPAWIDQHQRPRHNTAHDQIRIPLLH